MDDFVDERDYRLLDGDRYTFFVLRRIMGGSCTLLLTDHENLILCYSGSPYPVWIWTPDGAPESILERAYRLAGEHGLLVGGMRFNVKYELAEHFICRAAEDGRKLELSENMFAYDCLEPVPPAHETDGGLHRCTEDDLDELAEFVEQFTVEIGTDLSDRATYRANAARFIAGGRTFFWQNSAGRNVASCKYVPNGDLAAVNLVFTRPEHRRKHYAGNLVYRITVMAAAEGLTPMLYTNADYAPSNSCYIKLGYKLRGKLCTVLCGQGESDREPNED